MIVLMSNPVCSMVLKKTSFGGKVMGGQDCRIQFYKCVEFTFKVLVFSQQEDYAEYSKYIYVLKG